MFKNDSRNKTDDEIRLIGDNVSSYLIEVPVFRFQTCNDMAS